MNIEDFPEICGNEDEIRSAIKCGRDLYAPISNINLDKIESAFGIALHMHQPTIPAGTGNLRHAPLISNLQYMMEHQEMHDNHNAPVFLQCYSRMSDFIRELVAHHRNPRIMLDYSGNLLWGLKQIGQSRVLNNLKLVTCDKKYYRYVEWAGTMWSHAAASSTPVPDVKLHIMAWRHHFASIFGEEALSRVNGFSPPEMHLPIHPDVCYEYIKALKEAGYEWLMVQEHTIENLDGTGIRKPYFPHKLVAKNSLGEMREITVIIKTQGSDNKLIGQMQPYYEALNESGLKAKQEYAGRHIAPFVFQIGDGENGGVMMNEFPPKYKEVFREIKKEGVVAMNGSEYLELIKEKGVREDSFMPVQPVSQHRIWKYVTEYYPGACNDAINKVREEDPHFNLDKGSWTNDKNWVKGYENVLDPMNKLSAAFHRKYDGAAVDTKNPVYRQALLYLLLSETSCFRYWGQGIWTAYAAEICRRGMEVLK
jgi:hypothetical protein